MNQEFVLFLILLVAIALILIGYRRSARRHGVFGTGQSSLSLRTEQEVRQSLDGQMLELHELQRTLFARLDTKIRVIDHLVEEAKANLASLQDWHAKCETLKAELAALQAARAALPAPDATGDSTAAETMPTLELPAPPPDPEILRRIEQALQETTAPHEQIYRLADEGQDSLAIALETGMQRGEVELILRLRPRIDATPADAEAAPAIDAGASLSEHPA